MILIIFFFFFLFFFNDTATTEIYTLSLHDALPISVHEDDGVGARRAGDAEGDVGRLRGQRSEEHTSELQSRLHLVCRLRLEKKKQNETPPASQRSPAIDPVRPARWAPR